MSLAALQCRAGFFLSELIHGACEGSQGVLQISKNIRIEGKEEASLTIVSERKKSRYLARSLGFLVRRCAADPRYPSSFWCPSSAAPKMGSEIRSRGQSGCSRRRVEGRDGRTGRHWGGDFPRRRLSPSPLLHTDARSWHPPAAWQGWTSQQRPLPEHHPLLVQMP